MINFPWSSSQFNNNSVFFLITKNKTFVGVGGKVSVFSDPALRFRSATQHENYIVHPDISQVVGSNSKDQFVGAGEVDG